MLKNSLIDQEITVSEKLDYKSDQYLSLNALKMMRSIVCMPNRDNVQWFEDENLKVKQITNLRPFTFMI